MKSQFEYFKSLDEEGLKNFFSSPQKESQNLEFKSGKVDIEKLFKEICSFANTDGGLVVLGAPEEVSIPGSDEKVCQGSLTPSSLKLSEDDFLQKIGTGITPMPIGVEVHKIKLSVGAAFIIYTPKSLHPPHQVNGVYYIRIGTMCKPAPHGIVQALFNQRLQADLEFRLSVQPPENTEDRTSNLSINIKNKSNYPAQNVEGFIGIIGNVRQIRHERLDSENKMQNRLTQNGYSYLTHGFKFPNAIVDKIWNWRYYSYIRISGKHVYMRIVVWAKDTPAKEKLYKVYQDGRLEELDIELKNDPNFEYTHWIK